jgi:hypothetical protein
MTQAEEALKVIERIEGTAVADLDSLVSWVKAFVTDEKATQPVNGKLNFTLALASLIICETCGCYMLGALKRKKKDGDEADIGRYLMDFMKIYFDRSSFFKKISKVLADFLRHSLVHSYGSYTSPVATFKLALAISTDLTVQARASEKDGNRKMVLNSLVLAEQTLKAFQKFKAKVKDGKTKELVANIIKARDDERTVGKKIIRQFTLHYNKLLTENK